MGEEAARSRAWSPGAGSSAAFAQGLSRSLESFVGSTWPAAATASAVVAVVITFQTGIPLLPLTAALGAVLAVAIAYVVDRKEQAIVLGIFAWALLARLIVVLGLLLLDGGYATGDLLSPDGKGYFVGSRILAESSFAVGPPVAFFGTYDVGHYYLFAAFLSLFGPHLVVLEVLTATIGALAATIAFVWARLVVPRYAALIASLTALSPAMVLVATTNLLKDPAVMAATLAAVWAVAEIMVGRSRSRLLAFAALAALALASLHLTRFYVAVYVEAGLLVALIFRFVGYARGLRETSGTVLKIALIVGILVVGEVMPVAVGWPLGPAMIAAQVQYVTETPTILQSPPSPIDGTVTPHDAPANSPLTKALDVGRRIVGPFVWVPPNQGGLRYLLSADFDLYPDTVLWYVILPALVIGLLLSLVALWRDPAGALRLGHVAIFLCLYLGQYVAINLSYRQREDVLPLALAVVPVGARWIATNVFGRRLYAAYWVLLIVIAIGQVLLRATLR